MELDSNWDNYNSPTENDQSNFSRVGGFSRKFSVDAAYDGIKSDDFDTVAGRFYNVKAWVYADDDDKVHIQLRGGDGQSGTGANQNIAHTVTENAWTRLDFIVGPVNTGGDASRITFQSRAGVTSGTWYIDDVSVTEVGTLVDFNPRSASTTKWYNAAIPALYNGTLAGGVTLSAGSTDYEVGAGEDREVRLGNLAAGLGDAAGRVRLSHYDLRDNANDYALQHSSDGTLYLNAPTSKPIYFRQNNSTIAEFEGATGNLFIASGKKLGVGITPAVELHVLGGTAKIERAGDAPTLQLYNNTSNPADGAALGYLSFMGKDNDGTANQTYANISGHCETNTDSNVTGYLSFNTTFEGTATAERMRLTGAGDLQLKSATYNKLRFWRTDATIAAGDVLGAIYASGTDSNTGSAPFDGAQIRITC